MKGNKKGVSIIELMISIFMVTILWVVWALSFVWYMSSLRDSSRIIELHNIDAVFRWFNLRSGYYPEPSDFSNITYSWTLVWKQWTYWDSVSDIVWYSRMIADPLTNSKYTYSVTNLRNEYSIAWVLESTPDIVYKNFFLKETFAERIWETEWIAFVVWDYNWEILPIAINGINNILTVPSIVSSDLSSTDLVDIINNKKLVYTNYGNLPESYKWTKFNLSDGIDFSANDLVVFSWSITELNKTDNQIALVRNVCDSYSWSLLWSTISISTIDKVDLFSVTPSKTIERIVCDFVNFKLKYLVECG